MHTPNTARRRFAAGSLLLIALTGCGLMQPGPRQIDVSEAQLQSRIASQFPVKQRQLGLFDVTLEQPRLRLLPEENRVVTEMTYAVGVALTGVAPVKGQLELSYGLRYEPSDSTVRLHQVRVERLGVDGLSAAQAAQVKKIGGLMAEDLLKEAVVHRVKPEDLQSLSGRGYQPGVLKVVPGGLRLQLDPLDTK
ncbi:DUF1439 domain-containing protein [Hydrogenophaga sp. A37]|uniref:DUF1439 domain-containing protein n=1 Tax=Hydrogenophaga sp. A37 TaxID=1945864 RepID=UPI0009C955BB|nr:DUF1439 domain-containing protein [Hydrogenophaga sp. A37]OOG85577.1 hypothetical protein B0E41_07585 [Hydrogenophaga sp. A37]